MLHVSSASMSIIYGRYGNSESLIIMNAYIKSNMLVILSFKKFTVAALK